MHLNDTKRDVYFIQAMDSDFKFTDDKWDIVERTAWLGYWQDSPNDTPRYYFTVRWQYLAWRSVKTYSLSHEEYKTMLRYFVNTRKIKDTLSSHGSYKSSLTYESDYGLSPMPIHAQIEFYSDIKL